MWSVYTRFSDGWLRSNNVSESDHPVMWNFLDALNKQQSITRKDILECISGEVHVASKKNITRNKRLTTLIEKYKNKTSDIITTLRGVAMNYMY